MTEGYYDNELLLDGNVVRDGDVLPPDDLSLGDKKSAPVELERPEADQETTQTHNQHPAYVPGPLETRLEIHKDRVGPYRQQSDKEACIECGIIYEDLLAEQAASIAAMNAVDTFAANSIAKARRNK